MPIHRTSIEPAVPISTTNELSNATVKDVCATCARERETMVEFVCVVLQKSAVSSMNLSIEYDTPPIDSLPMDEEDGEDDDEEVRPS